MVNKELKKIIRCPLCRGRLTKTGETLVCSKKHAYPITEIPILLKDSSKEEEIIEQDLMAGKYIKEREKNLLSMLVNERWNNRIVDLISSKPERILELGCGTGMLLKKLKKSFKAELFGFDVSSGMVRYANLKNPGNVFVADAEAIPLESNCFDVVVCRGALHHIPDVEKAFQNVRRILKKGGIFIFSEPNNSNFLFRLYRRYVRKHRAFLPSELKELLEKNGFNVVEEEYFGFFTFPFAVPDLSKLRIKSPLFLNFLTLLDKKIESSKLLQKFCWHLIFKCSKK